MKVPNKLRVRMNGRIATSDGSAVAPYLRDWAAHNKVTPGTPVVLIERAYLIHLLHVKQAAEDARFAMAS